jgi:hypothetical protein
MCARHGHRAPRLCGGAPTGGRGARFTVRASMKHSAPVRQTNNGGELSKQRGNGEAGTLTGVAAVNDGEWCSGGQR